MTLTVELGLDNAKMNQQATNLGHGSFNLVTTYCPNTQTHCSTWTSNSVDKRVRKSVRSTVH